MLISVLNIKLTCEWHKAIKLNYKNTRTQVIVVPRFPSTMHDMNAQQWHNIMYYIITLKELHMQFRDSVSLNCRNMAPHWRTGMHKTVSWQVQWLEPQRRPHFSLAVTVQHWTKVFWVISVYFNIRNTLPKSGTFLLGHSVYRGIKETRYNNPLISCIIISDFCSRNTTW
jgi:hypothetical protein